MSDSGLVLAGISHCFAESDWRLSVDAFSVNRRTFTGIIGPNGSGKSTLLRIAAGVLTPVSGEVLLDGAPLAGMDRRQVAQRLGYLPQEVTSLFDYSVEEVVRMGRYPHASAFGALGSTDGAIVQRCLERAELSALRKRPLSHLSGGERKRAILASVLAQEPEILLLDEPTAALDMHHQVRFFQLVHSLSKGGMGVAVVTHDINLAALFCDRLLLMAGGRLVIEGAPGEVLQRERLEAVYGPEVLVTTHPQTGGPMLLPRRAPGGDS